MILNVADPQAIIAPNDIEPHVRIHAYTKEIEQNPIKSKIWMWNIQNLIPIQMNIKNY